MIRQIDRRHAVTALAVLGLCGVSRVGAVPALPSLATIDGSAIRNWPAPDTARILQAPCVVIVGAPDADITIVELFDYNCGYCKHAAAELDQVLRDDGRITLALINNPFLSAGSTGAARVQAAVKKLAGARSAYRFHLALMQSPGQANERRALDVAQSIGLDRAPLIRTMTDANIASQIRQQKLFATDSHLPITPTFIMGGVAFAGWPGVATMVRFVAAARRCGSLHCGDSGQSR